MRGPRRSGSVCWFVTIVDPPCLTLICMAFRVHQAIPNRDKSGSAIRKLGYRVPKQERTSLRPNQRRYQTGRVLESVNHELISGKFSPLGAPATQSMTPSSREKSGGTPMPNSNDVASNEMLWERVLSLLVVGGSVLGGSAVLLIQALPSILHGFP
jgi:hypothetical protein